MNRYTTQCGAIPPARQHGAALVIGLILLLVLTILAVSGVMTSRLELRMVGNTQLQERAFQAAEVAIEMAMANAPLSTSAPFTQPAVAMPNMAGDQYSFQVQYAGQTAAGPGLTGYSIGSGFTAFHFVANAGGTAPGNAQAQHVQGFYIVGPGGS